MSTGGPGANAAKSTFHSFLVAAASASIGLILRGSLDNTVELDSISLAPIREAPTFLPFGRVAAVSRPGRAAGGAAAEKAAAA